MATSLAVARIAAVDYCGGRTMDARVLRPVFFFAALRLATFFFAAGRLPFRDLRATFFLRVAMVTLGSCLKMDLDNSNTCA
jgi:hypothetical protein